MTTEERREVEPEPARLFAAVPSDQAKRNLHLTCLFGAFVFLQFTVLGLANHAGEGYLATEQRDMVYYALQVFVILGYLLHCLFASLCTGKRIRSAVAYAVFGLFFVCVAAMLAIGTDSVGSVVVSMGATLCLGGIGGATHLRMSGETSVGTGVARSMGLGSAVAVAMQYLLQIQWGPTPLLPVFMLAAFVLLLLFLLRETPRPDAVAGLAPSPTPPRRIATSVLIASAFILFTCFYNEYIHHLMIQSDYASYSVYCINWPGTFIHSRWRVLLAFPIAGSNGRGRRPARRCPIGNRVNV